MPAFLLTIAARVGTWLIGAYNKRVDSAHQLEIVRINADSQREQVLAVNQTARMKAELEAQTAAERTQASVIKHAMSHQVFWWVWALFAIPLGMWWALVMLDTMTPPHILSLRIPTLPASIQPYADQIFNNVFYSGAAVGGVQILGRALVGRR